MRYLQNTENNPIYLFIYPYVITVVFIVTVG